MQRHAYHLHSGSLSYLNLIEEPLPGPETGEVTIAVKAIGLNFADIFAIWGLYSATPAGEFNWEDPLLLEQQLTEQERMVRDSTYSYCQEQLLPRVLTARASSRRAALKFDAPIARILPSSIRRS